MPETIRDYELAYLLDPRLTDEEILKWQENFKNFLATEMTGEFKKEVSAKKRKLAYPVKKQSLAYFGSIYFVSQPEKVDLLDKKLKLENNVLRYLILQVDRRKQKELLRREKEILEKVFKKVEIKDKAKVDLEELDKKLEEILSKPEKLK